MPTRHHVYDCAPFKGVSKGFSELFEISVYESVASRGVHGGNNGGSSFASASIASPPQSVGTREPPHTRLRSPVHYGWSPCSVHH